MVLTSEKQIDFINTTTKKLVEFFLEPVFNLNQEKSYYTHVGSLAEISEWSLEFYNKYYEKVTHWEHESGAGEYPAHRAAVESLIIAFGKERLKKISRQRENISNSFFDVERLKE
jgi:hypothetical protein